jgi:hypothetical protein
LTRAVAGVGPGLEGWKLEAACAPSRRNPIKAIDGFDVYLVECRAGVGGRVRTPLPTSNLPTPVDWENVVRQPYSEHSKEIY